MARRTPARDNSNSPQNGHSLRERVTTSSQPIARNTSALSREVKRLVANEQSTLTRLALLRAISGQLPEIDIDRECRYPSTLQLSDYYDLYTREGVATRVVEVYPDESWQMEPEIYETDELDTETEFEKAWVKMNEEFNVLSHLQTLDEICGIGNFGLLLLGFDDGSDLSKPVINVKRDGTVDARFRDKKLIYLRSIPQAYGQIMQLEKDVTNRRYGQPTLYSIQVTDVSATPSKTTGGGGILWGSNDVAPLQPTVSRAVTVHWTRVIHVADNRTTSELYGVPRLQNVFNYCLNIKKILGANGQGYWQVGVPGFSIETQPNIENPDFDLDSAKQEIQDFLSGLQRYIAMGGLTTKPLQITLPDPKAHFETQLSAICMTKGIPMRVFKGSEEAKLASSQDMRTWNKRLAKRNSEFTTPYVLRAFFKRMIAVGALPEPKQLVLKWPDLNSPTEADRATVASKITDSLQKYVAGNLFLIMPPKEYLVDVLGFPLEKVNAILKSAGVKKMTAYLEKLAKIATTPPPTPISATSAKKKIPSKQKKPPADAGAGPNS